MILRVNIQGQTDNHGPHNLYDVAMDFASWLVMWEIPFEYAYPEEECVFVMLSDHEPEELLNLIKTEFPKWQSLERLPSPLEEYKKAHGLS